MLKKEIAAIIVFGLLLCGCSVKMDDHVQAPTESETGSYMQIDDDTFTTHLTEETTEPEIETSVEATTEVTTVPSSEPTQLPEVIITKNPTSEKVSPGERTWFIAHADNDTSIVWEIFSPDGAMYTVNEAMSIHPGLILDILPEDTLGLRNIPASFDGWSARARFNGPGGTAVTECAKIMIRDPYEQIIEDYRKVWKNGEPHYELGVSELATGADYIGHTTMDLDGNGVQELLIVVVGSTYDGVLCEVYTMQDGKAVNVLQSWARSRTYLLADGRLYTEGSSGAAFQTYCIEIVDGTSCYLIESIDTSDVKNGLDDPTPHYYYSDLSQEKVPIYSEEAYAMIDGWRSQIWIPELTYIS